MTMLKSSSLSISGGRENFHNVFFDVCHRFFLLYLRLYSTVCPKRVCIHTHSMHILYTFKSSQGLSAGTKPRQPRGDARGNPRNAENPDGKDISIYMAIGIHSSILNPHNYSAYRLRPTKLQQIWCRLSRVRQVRP